MYHMIHPLSSCHKGESYPSRTRKQIKELVLASRLRSIMGEVGTAGLEPAKCAALPTSEVGAFTSFATSPSIYALLFALPQRENPWHGAPSETSFRV